MAQLFKLVLVEKIAEHEADGWQLLNKRVHVAIGGWASVYMMRVI